MEMTRDQIAARIEETEALVERALSWRNSIHGPSLERYAAGEEIDRLRFVLLNLRGMLEDPPSGCDTEG
tara:strand:+ start:495 stop:701 length:207 start_codon:yes stop_codon:yes gene_type:complete